MEEIIKDVKKIEFLFQNEGRMIIEIDSFNKIDSQNLKIMLNLMNQEGKTWEYKNNCETLNLKANFSKIIEEISEDLKLDKQFQLKIDELPKQILKNVKTIESNLKKISEEKIESNFPDFDRKLIKEIEHLSEFPFNENEEIDNFFPFYKVKAKNREINKNENGQQENQTDEKTESESYYTCKEDNKSISNDELQNEYQFNEKKVEEQKKESEKMCFKKHQSESCLKLKFEKEAVDGFKNIDKLKNNNTFQKNIENIEEQLKDVLRKMQQKVDQVYSKETVVLIEEIQNHLKNKIDEEEKLNVILSEKLEKQNQSIFVENEKKKDIIEKMLKEAISLNKCSNSFTKIRQDSSIIFDLLLNFEELLKPNIQKILKSKKITKKFEEIQKSEVKLIQKINFVTEKMKLINLPEFLENILIDQKPHWFQYDEILRKLIKLSAINSKNNIKLKHQNSSPRKDNCESNLSEDVAVPMPNLCETKIQSVSSIFVNNKKNVPKKSRPMIHCYTYSTNNYEKIKTENEKRLDFEIRDKKYVLEKINKKIVKVDSTISTFNKKMKIKFDNIVEKLQDMKTSLLVAREKNLKQKHTAQNSVEDHKFFIDEFSHSKKLIGDNPIEEEIDQFGFAGRFGKRKYTDEIEEENESSDRSSPKQEMTGIKLTLIPVDFKKHISDAKSSSEVDDMDENEMVSPKDERKEEHAFDFRHIPYFDEIQNDPVEKNVEIPELHQNELNDQSDYKSEDNENSEMEEMKSIENKPKSGQFNFRNIPHFDFIEEKSDEEENQKLIDIKTVEMPQNENNSKLKDGFDSKEKNTKNELLNEKNAKTDIILAEIVLKVSQFLDQNKGVVLEQFNSELVIDNLQEIFQKFKDLESKNNDLQKENNVLIDKIEEYLNKENNKNKEVAISESFSILNNKTEKEQEILTKKEKKNIVKVESEIVSKNVNFELFEKYKKVFRLSQNLFEKMKNLIEDRFLDDVLKINNLQEICQEIDQMFVNQGFIAVDR